MSEKKQTARKAVKAEQPSRKEAGFCAYIGPTILGVIQNGTLIPGSKQVALASVQTAVSKYPLIRTLIVDGNDLATDRIRVKTPGNLLYVNYHKLQSGKK